MLGVKELTVRRARELLTEWASVAASRDDRVRIAFASGLSKSEISRLTGVARTTVDRILEARPARCQTAHRRNMILVGRHDCT